MFRPIVESLVGSRSRGFTHPGAAMAAAAVVATTMIALPGSASAEPVTSGAGDVSILSVDYQADGITRSQVASAVGTVDQSDAEIDLLAVTVDAGFPMTLRPTGAYLDVRNVAYPGDVAGITVSENGTLTPTSAAAEFEAAAERALNSSDLRDYIKSDALSRPGAGWGADYDVVFSSPLIEGQFLLVEERHGNARFELTALDATGAPIAGGQPVGVDAPYGWNSGFAPADYAEAQPVHLTVIEVGRFLPAGVTSMSGVRIDNNDEADIKLVPLGGALYEESAPAGPSLPQNSEGLAFTKTVYVGADGGVGCPTAASYAEAGQTTPVTYCFTVTNTGPNAVTNIAISDPYVAAQPTLLSADSTPLAPGHSARYYVESLPPADAADGAVDDTYTNVASVTVQPVDGALAPLGDPLTSSAQAVVFPAEDLPQPHVDLKTSVYEGIDGGTGCPAADVTIVDEGDPITYCFVVTNIGNTHLDSIAITDPIAGLIERAGVLGTPVLLQADAFPLAPGASALYYLDALAPPLPSEGLLFTSSAVTANSVDSAGADLTGLPDVTDDDGAEIKKPAPAVPVASAKTPVKPPKASSEVAQAPRVLAFTGWETWVIVTLGIGLIAGGLSLLQPRSPNPVRPEANRD